MGMFTKTQKAQSDNIYEKEVKSHIAPKDGFTHVLMINSFSKWINQLFGVEDKYTTQIDNILTKMQKEGYEIISVEHTAIKNQGLFKDMERFHTLISYK